jgi:hypothetical protein
MAIGETLLTVITEATGHRKRTQLPSYCFQLPLQVSVDDLCGVGERNGSTVVLQS